MNWGYPRTWEGFLHALTRGQYEKTNPTSSIFRFLDQVSMLISGAVDEFNLVYLLIGLIPFFFYFRMQKRERAWLIGLTAIYLCLSLLLILLLNPTTDRQSRGLTKVFFIPSHIIISIGIGYGLTLIAAVLATQYERHRRWALIGSAIATAVALYSYANLESQQFLATFTALFGIGLALVCVVLFLIYTARPPLGPLLAVFAIMPDLDGLAFSVGRRAQGVADHFDEPRDVREWLAGLLDTENAAVRP
jgi:hypothetical protein